MSEKNFSFERKIPLALLFTLLVQCAACVWWASATSAEDRFRDQRLDVLEARGLRADAGHSDVLQRLARLEAYAESEARSLRRIEAALASEP